MAIIIYADGACRGNPGPGGWGFHLVHENGSTAQQWGGSKFTTNNQMELLALINALKCTPLNASITVYTDSQYCVKGMSSWIKGWKKNGWKSKSGAPIKNKELWMELDALSGTRHVEWVWVKGHAGDPGNELADTLANRGIDEA